MCMCSPSPAMGNELNISKKNFQKGQKTNKKKTNFDNNIKRVIDLCKKTDPLPCSLK